MATRPSGQGGARQKEWRQITAVCLVPLHILKTCFLFLDICSAYMGLHDMHGRLAKGAGSDKGQLGASLVTTAGLVRCGFVVALTLSIRPRIYRFGQTSSARQKAQTPSIWSSRPVIHQHIWDVMGMSWFGSRGRLRVLAHLGLAVARSLHRIAGLPAFSWKKHHRSDYRSNI